MNLLSDIISNPGDSCAKATKGKITKRKANAVMAENRVIKRGQLNRTPPDSQASFNRQEAKRQVSMRKAGKLELKLSLIPAFLI